MITKTALCRFGSAAVAALTLVGFSLLSGCASPPKPPALTTLTATVAATQNANPDARNRPSPIVVRVYELRTTATFNGADFFALFDKDRETLAADLVTRDEFTIRPGDSVPINREAKSETRHIAVIAVFRELERSVWRASAPVALGQNNRISVAVDGRNVSLTVAAAPK